ncbi:hypothetical protein DSCO28_28170 [Desulfosarcina ovata subsp. sediminis]|uniref:Uncharacterized protein n=1 Tax=Desulfosarcina ovata subsp. sediminis TaxID=885957 RepID=A0A5K7ZMI1_9BACT|nr:hypothetical protein [Desulfosarcina ovata]BBO82251.1 hypothetical protein DSCO28_28170 [Desulfosarcina ovata subsp. sediminis]
MLKIDRLQLRLPAEYQDQAHLIARWVAEELGGVPVAAGGTRERLAVPPINAVPGTGGRHIARQIAAAVADQLSAGRQGLPLGLEARSKATDS